MNDSSPSPRHGVTVYTAPGCVQCDATRRALSSHGIAFAEVDLGASPDVLARLKADGWMRAPIVQTGDGQAWSGFRPDKIKELAHPKASPAINGEPVRPSASCRRSVPGM
ncbi:MAG: NrdH-redoxin [Actinomyces sp.]|jgi:glutaredoxin-like protein NrdH|nr:glutaredoxin domain-containing protein [Actinomyces sp.]MCI1788026.1 NrdH-redoxin [Actinomyces sp.]MCI1830575.1 NrdH-redoxin [Actinomyces sp.]